MTATPDLMTAVEVAQLLARAGHHVHPETVRRWGRTGKLAVVKMPGGSKARVLFRRTDVLALLRARREGVAR